MHKVARPAHEGIFVLDFGSQYTQLIARRLREIRGFRPRCSSGRAAAPPAVLAHRSGRHHPVGRPRLESYETVAMDGCRIRRCSASAGAAARAVLWHTSSSPSQLGGRVRVRKSIASTAAATLHLEKTELGAPAHATRSTACGCRTAPRSWMSHGDSVVAQAAGSGFLLLQSPARKASSRRSACHARAAARGPPVSPRGLSHRATAARFS